MMRTRQSSDYINSNAIGSSILVPIDQAFTEKRSIESSSKSPRVSSQDSNCTKKYIPLAKSNTCMSFEVFDFMNEDLFKDNSPTRIQPKYRKISNKNTDFNLTIQRVHREPEKMQKIISKELYKYIVCDQL